MFTFWGTQRTKRPFHKGPSNTIDLCEKNNKNKMAKNKPTSSELRKNSENIAEYFPKVGTNDLGSVRSNFVNQHAI